MKIIPETRGTFCLIFGLLDLPPSFDRYPVIAWGIETEPEGCEYRDIRVVPITGSAHTPDPLESLKDAQVVLEYVDDKGKAYAWEMGGEMFTRFSSVETAVAWIAEQRQQERK